MSTLVLYRLTYLYLALPLLFFLMTWLDSGWAFLFTLMYGIAFYKAHKTISEQNNHFVSNGVLRGLAVLSLVWCFFAGIGYFYYQSFDYHFRNAVFRDLINYDWPVMYDKANTPLVYYMAFWLPVAGVCKLMIPIIQNANQVFMIGNVLLLFYAAFGVWLIFAHLIKASCAENKKQAFMTAAVFMLFSGLDIIGYQFFQIMAQPFDYHLEWWTTTIQYSSMTTGLFWVFNQFIPVALLTLLIYNERNIKNFGLLIALSLFFTPYPTAGLGIFMLAYAGTEFYYSQAKKIFLRDCIFSVQNIIGVFWLLPILILYFITNSEGIDKLWYVFDYTTPQRLLLFMTLEFLLYALVLGGRYKKECFFITAVASLIVIPFFRLDQQNNFCTRASIPALIILALYAIRFLKENKNTLAKGALLILLTIGAATPLMEFYRGIHYTMQAGRLGLTADEIYTLNQGFVRMPLFGWDANHQYTALDYKTDIFWRYFAKRHTPFDE